MGISYIWTHVMCPRITTNEFGIINTLSEDLSFIHLPSWWRHQMETFSALLALCAGKSTVPVNPPHKGKWRGALMFSLICAWINGCVNSLEAGDLRRHGAHYVVTVMIILSLTVVNTKISIHPRNAEYRYRKCHVALIDDKSIQSVSVTKLIPLNRYV